jgi:hypothetical protein
MANTYTTNVGLAEASFNDSGWNVTLNTNFTTLDALTAIGALAVQLHEIPSISLNVKVSAGSFRKSDATIVTYAGTASQALTANSTNYLYLTDSGSLVVNTTGFPAATFLIRIATVTTNTTTVTGITDARVPLVSMGANANTIYLALAGGTMADGANIAVGTGTGTKIGTATTQKQSLWNVVPIVQPSGASQAAITNSSGGTPGASITAVGATNTGDVSGTINNNFATLWTLLNAIRTAMVNYGSMKGGA